MEDSDISPRSRLVAALLCFFFGCLGVHRFYAGKIGTGILMLVTLGGLGIWYLVDLIIILSGTFQDMEGRLIHTWLEPQLTRQTTQELTDRLDEIERRLTDTQDVMIDLSEKYDHLLSQIRDSGG